jgi:biotin carboxyl carrier protein
MKLLINGKPIEVLIESISQNKIIFTTNGKSYLVERQQEVPGHTSVHKQLIRPSSKKSGSTTAQGETEINAPIPGVVSKIFISPGDTVEEGDPLLVLEAMKMQNRILATHAGIVSSVKVQNQQEVSDGQLLLVIKDK